MAGRTRSIKCPYDQKKECSSGCIHTKTCAMESGTRKGKKDDMRKQKERHGSMELCKVRIGENAEKTEK